MKRPIAISLSPNTEKDDVVLALKTLLKPWKWFDIEEVELLEMKFEEMYPGFKAVAVNSGRSAEYVLLKAMGIGKGDEVLVQAFTCIAVPNSIMWLGAKPIYIDVDQTFNMDIDDLKKKMSAKTKAIIIQNTFGMPANIDEIKNFAKLKKIRVIADCAHALGGKYKGKDIAEVVDSSFFSFGRDKIISSVFGGMILCSDENLYEKMKLLRDNLKNPSAFWVIQQLVHPIAFAVLLPVYNFFNVGKVILFVLQRFGLLSKAIYPLEKRTKRPDVFPGKMPGALAVLAQHQLAKVDEFNAHRMKIARIYFDKLDKLKFELPVNKKGSVWLRFPILSRKRDEVFSDLKRRRVLVGDWYKDVLSPSKSVDLFGYVEGSCQNAERYAKEILNLPTYPNLSVNDAMRIVKILNDE